MQRRVYHDFDAFADDVGDIDAIMMLQNPKRRHWSIERIDIAGIHIQRGRLGSGNIVEGQWRADGYGLYLPLSATCEYLANGESFGRESFMVLEPGSQFCISTKGEHDWCSVFVPTHLLQRNAVPAASQPISGKTSCRVSHPNRQLADTFAALARDIIEAATNCARFEGSPAAKRAAATAPAVVSRVLRDLQRVEDTPKGRPRISRDQIVRHCKQRLAERPRQPIRVSELAMTAGVSNRTLETAFKEYFGVCPKRYLTLRRLHAVRLALSAADADEMSVTDVLIRNGEWEFGRLTKSYHELFGELPSATLRRRRS